MKGRRSNKMEEEEMKGRREDKEIAGTEVEEEKEKE